MNSIIINEVFIKVIPFIFAAGILSLGVQTLLAKLERKIKEKSGESTTERIERLSRSLKESILLTSEIEKEIEQRHSIVKKLRDDVSRYEQLAKLKESEVEAVAQTLRGEIRNEGTKSLVMSALVSLAFFIAGVLVTLYAS